LFGGVWFGFFFWFGVFFGGGGCLVLVGFLWFVGGFCLFFIFVLFLFGCLFLVGGGCGVGVWFYFFWLVSLWVVMGVRGRFVFVLCWVFFGFGLGGLVWWIFFWGGCVGGGEGLYNPPHYVVGFCLGGGGGGFFGFVPDQTSRNWFKGRRWQCSCGGHLRGVRNQLRKKKWNAKSCISKVEQKNLRNARSSRR